MGSDEVGEKRDGRAMLQLSEKEEELEPFLRLVDRDRFEVDGNALDLDLTALVRISQLLDKYDASTLSFVVFGGYLHRLLPNLRQASDLMT